MQWFFAAIILLIGGTWIIGAACLPFSTRFRGVRRRLAATFGAILMGVGAAGFFGSALSSAGGLSWLPPTFEWPLGSADGVVTMPDGTRVVPHTPSGRVQLYDKDWRFIRGWHVVAFGGTFCLAPVGDDRFDVLTARRNVRYTYALSGDLIASANYTDADWNALVEAGERHAVPTSPWLWPFSHPFHAWPLAVTGMGILIALNDPPSRRRRRTPA